MKIFLEEISLTSLFYVLKKRHTFIFASLFPLPSLCSVSSLLFPSPSQVLLVSSRNSKGSWTIPGGGLEPNETPSQTVLREAREEVGSLLTHCPLNLKARWAAISLLLVLLVVPMFVL